MTFVLALFLCFLAPPAFAQSITALQSFFTHPTDCRTTTDFVRQNQFCIDLDDFTLWLCNAPAGGPSDELCDQADDWSRVLGTLTDADIPNTITASNYLPLTGGALTGSLTVQPLASGFPTGAGQLTFDTTLSRLRVGDGLLAERLAPVFYHATDCRTLVTSAVVGDHCSDLATGLEWLCNNPAQSGVATVCDGAGDWTPSGDGNTPAALGLQANFAIDNVINTAGPSRKLRIGDASTYVEMWANAGTFFQQVTPPQNLGFTVSTGFSWILYKNNGTTPLLSVSEAGVGDAGSLVSLKLPTAAGAAPTASGLVAYDSTANQFEGGFNGTNKVLASLSGAFTNDQCLKWSTAANAIVSSGAACGTGGGSLTPPIVLTPATDSEATFAITNAAPANRIRLGTVTSNPALGAVYLGAGTPSATNYALSGDLTTTNLNAGTSLVLATVGAVRGLIDSNGLTTATQFRFQYGAVSAALQLASAGVIEANNATAGQNAPFISGFRDAGANTLGVGLTVRRQSSVTALDGLGVSQLFQINSSTTANQDAVKLDALWSNATHGQRTANLVFSLMDNGTMREIARFTPTGLTMPATSSIYWDAGSMTVDGTNCIAPTTIQINGGPRGRYFTCADTNASIFEGRITMPDAYTGGPVTFELTVNHPTTEAITFATAFSAMCRRPGTTVDSTWGTDSGTLSVAITTANQPAQGTSAPVTPSGTCQGGDTLYWRSVIVAGSFSTNAANTRVEGVKMEYPVLSSTDN